MCVEQYFRQSCIYKVSPWYVKYPTGTNHSYYKTKGPVHEYVRHEMNCGPQGCRGIGEGLSPSSMPPPGLPNRDHSPLSAGNPAPATAASMHWWPHLHLLMAQNEWCRHQQQVEVGPAPSAGASGSYSPNYPAGAGGMKKPSGMTGAGSHHSHPMTAPRNRDQY